MMKALVKILAAIAIAVPATAEAGLTLDSCLSMARDNYPLIRRYSLLEYSTDLELSDINKSWLPQVSIYVQGTVQNSVPAFPAVLGDIMAQMGQDFKGMDKFQYKGGVDVTQTIWDGGMSKARRETVRRQKEQQDAQLDVEMYAVNERVRNLYFGILLMDEQMAQMRNTIGLLDANISEMKAMYRNGTAMQSDVDMLEARKLELSQQLTTAQGSAAEYRRMLGIYVGKDVAGDQLMRPVAEMPASMESNRPELAAFNSRIRLIDSRKAAITASVMPKVGLFVQAYEGYPGFNYFKSMRSHDPSFNVMAGIKASWSLESLYTRKNSMNRIRIDNETVQNDRDMFLFNSSLQSNSELAQIESLRKVMADDGRIVELRGNVRRAAESQLRNGVIDATALLTKITDENNAGLTATYHEIRLIQLIYQLKNTLNR